MFSFSCLYGIFLGSRRRNYRKSRIQSERDVQRRRRDRHWPRDKSVRISSLVTELNELPVRLVLMDVGGNVLQAATKTVTKDIDGDQSWLVEVDPSPETFFQMSMIDLGLRTPNETDGNGRERH